MFDSCVRPIPIRQLQRACQRSCHRAERMAAGGARGLAGRSTWSTSLWARPTTPNGDLYRIGSNILANSAKAVDRPINTGDTSRAGNRFATRMDWTGNRFRAIPPTSSELAGHIRRPQCLDARRKPCEEPLIDQYSQGGQEDPRAQSRSNGDGGRSVQHRLRIQKQRGLAKTSLNAAKNGQRPDTEEQ